MGSLPDNTIISRPSTNTNTGSLISKPTTGDTPIHNTGGDTNELTQQQYYKADEVASKKDLDAVLNMVNNKIAELTSRVDILDYKLLNVSAKVDKQVEDKNNTPVVDVSDVSSIKEELINLTNLLAGKLDEETFREFKENCKLKFNEIVANGTGSATIAPSLPSTDNSSAIAELKASIDTIKATSATVADLDKYVEKTSFEEYKANNTAPDLSGYLTKTEFEEYKATN